MTNFAFKNALIGGKGSLDASWPSLNESNNSKPLYGSNRKTEVESQTKYDKKNSSIYFSDLPSSNCAKSDLAQPISNPQKVQLLKEEFPDLCKTSFFKTKSKNSLKKNTSENDVMTNSTPKNCFRYTFKHIKLKKDAVSVPLLSLVKVPHMRKKLPTRRKNLLQNVLCGNKLDGDQPVRRKGKVRLQKKKFESRIKKEITISKKLRTRKIYYSQSVLRAKCIIPSLICCQNEISPEKLAPLLSAIQIEENESQSENVQNKNPQLLSCVQEGTAYELLPDMCAKNILHSQSFKEYCNNVVNPSLLKSIETLIVTLRNFQDRLHAKDPAKAFAKRRYLCGFKESKKFLLANRVKLLIVATNLQIDLDLPSGRILREIKSLAEEREVPLVFGGRANQIGYWTLKRRRISIVSILNYEGAEEHFKNVITNRNECSKMYKSILEEIENYLLKHNPTECVEPNKKLEEEIREKILSKLSLESDKQDCAIENV